MLNLRAQKDGKTSLKDLVLKSIQPVSIHNDENTLFFKFMEIKAGRFLDKFLT